jgi:hypothetical protein
MQYPDILYVCDVLCLLEPVIVRTFFLSYFQGSTGEQNACGSLKNTGDKQDEEYDMFFSPVILGISSTVAVISRSESQREGKQLFFP